MKIGSNRDIDKDHKKWTPPEPGKAWGAADDAPKMMKGADEPVKDPCAARHDLKMHTEKHNDEKLFITFLIVGAGLIAYHFW